MQLLLQKELSPVAGRAGQIAVRTTAPEPRQPYLRSNGQPTGFRTGKDFEHGYGSF